jgi:small-conductance mechanosensitive channel
MPTLDTHVFDIARVIQLAIAPVFMLTAIATIINVLITRLARAVDRRRVLDEQMPEFDDEHVQQARAEYDLLNRRVKLILWSVTLAVLAALMVCLLIGTAFAGAFVQADLSRPVATLFIVAVLSLTGSLLTFLREITLSARTAFQTITPYALRTPLK